MPFHLYGLWLAVIMIPPAAPRCLTSSESAGEEQPSSAIHTGIPATETASAATRAKRSEPKRVSYPTRTPALGFSARTTYRVIAHDTLRTFAKVKSSAITPRHPSVPNLIVLTVHQYKRTVRNTNRNLLAWCTQVAQASACG